MIRKLFFNTIANCNRNFRKNSSYAALTLEDLPVNFKLLEDESALKSAEENIRERKGVGNITRVVALKKAFYEEINLEKKQKLYKALLNEVLKLPNSSHPVVESYKDRPHVLRPAQRLKHGFRADDFSKLASNLKLLRTDGLAALTGAKSYYLLEDLADLEHALIRFAVKKLVKNGFSLVSVPDMLPCDIVERCGMTTRGERAQVYFLHEKEAKDVCLSGTSEMALAGLVAGKTFTAEELPLRLCAVSRCYRSETSNLAEEKGIYRVHQFTKVEMFSISSPQDSDKILADFLKVQEEIFKDLELDYQTLDMPRHELGAPAYRKHDIEAWFPVRKNFGELSSCSNCTDYQARRLGIRTEGGSFAHTINGTACAIPRTIMALVETLQTEKGSIRIPKVLHTLMGREEITARNKLVEVERSRSKEKVGV